MERLMAHEIIYDGRHYRMSVIELDASGAIRIYPYTHEIHSTRFVNGSVEVTVSGNPPHLVAKPVK